MFDLTLWQWIVVGAAVVFVGIAKAGFGGGIGILVTPMMALVLSPAESIGIMLPVLCACDLAAIWHYRKTWDFRNVAMLLPGAVVGIGLGTYFLGKMNDNWLGLAIGAISIGFVARHAWQEWKKASASPFKPTLPVGASFGVAAGVTSTLAHAAGPVTAMFLLPQKMDRKRFVGTTVIFFTLVNAAKLPPYIALDYITLERFKLSAALAALFVPLGVFLGIWMNTRINETWFNRIVYVVLLLAGIDLVHKNLAALLGG